VANEALDVLETSRHAVLRRVAPAAAALAALAIGVPLLRRRRRGRRGR
jgi:hypothetical protein